MKWYLLTMKTGPEDGSYIKPHLVSEEIKQNILENLETRFRCKMKYSEAENGYILDLPGMIKIDREIYDVNIKDFLLRIPASDFEYYYSKLKNSKPRNEIGTDYYKLHGYMICVCLTSKEREVMLEQMKNTLEEAKAVAQIEENEWAETSKKLNEHANIMVPLRNNKTIPEA